jgi:hypothetical protein
VTLLCAASLAATAGAGARVNAVGPTEWGRVVISTSTIPRGQRFHVVNKLPARSVVKLASAACAPTRGARRSCALTFVSPRRYIALVASTCKEQTVIPRTVPCKLTFVTSPAPITITRIKGGKSVTYKVITPPTSLVRAA